MCKCICNFLDPSTSFLKALPSQESNLSDGFICSGKQHLFPDFSVASVNVSTLTISPPSQLSAELPNPPKKQTLQSYFSVPNDFVRVAQRLFQEEISIYSTPSANISFTRGPLVLVDLDLESIHKRNVCVFQFLLMGCANCTNIATAWLNY